MLVNFDEYSLVLVKDDKIVFSSDKHGLRPLVECVCSTEGEELFDKVIGLAAARVIVACGFIKKVHTIVCSKSAKDLLEENGIVIDPKEIVENIMNKDKTDVCPMEKRAREVIDNNLFFNELKEKFEIIS